MSSGSPGIFGSQILSDRAPNEGGADYWKSLFYYNIYRMLLAVFFAIASMADFNVGSLGSRHPDLFQYTSICYAFLSLAFALTIHSGRPGYTSQCRIQILTDLIIIIALYHSSSGRGAGLEILFFITVSASGILLGGRGALVTAAAATILLIMQHFYVIATDQRAPGGFTTLGFIGGGLFATAFIIYSLTLLLRKSEVEVAQQSIDLRKLSHINNLIVEELQSGIIVVDRSLKPLLINQSGRKLLSLENSSALPDLLEDLLPEAALKIYGIDEAGEWNTENIDIEPNRTLQIRYKPLGDIYQSGYIILVDDYSEIEKEQRNEKFIAMGRLSASIAHEIRNPLGAISHAGQLLAESDDVAPGDHRLLEIINKQSARINQIIENVLDLGRPSQVNIKPIRLRAWLDRIVDDVVAEKALVTGSIHVEGDGQVTVCGDPDQLRLVILNLLQNGLRHGDKQDLPVIRLDFTVDAEAGECHVKIYDNGPGVTPGDEKRIFEPFYTTSSSGNGLGLYISTRICEANNANLDYHSLSINDDNHFVLSLSLARNGSCD